MVRCISCGVENVDGARFCVKCGAAIGSPAPGSWRADQSDPDDQSTEYAAPPPSFSMPPVVYPQPPSVLPYQQETTSQSIHPAIPAVVSLLFPGLGLLFVRNKAGLGVGIFAGYIALNIAIFFLAVITLGIGSCLFLLVPLANVIAAVHSYDVAAKSSNNDFQPILFK